MFEFPYIKITNKNQDSLSIFNLFKKLIPLFYAKVISFLTTEKKDDILNKKGNSMRTQSTSKVIYRSLGNQTSNSTNPTLILCLKENIKTPQLKNLFLKSLKIIQFNHCEVSENFKRVMAHLFQLSEENIHSLIEYSRHTRSSCFNPFHPHSISDLLLELNYSSHEIKLKPLHLTEDLFFEHMDLSGLNLRALNLTEFSLNETNFTNTDLEEAEIDLSKVNSTNFTNTNIARANLYALHEQKKSQEPYLWNHVNLKNSVFYNVNSLFDKVKYEHIHYCVDTYKYINVIQTLDDKFLPLKISSLNYFISILNRRMKSNRTSINECKLDENEQEFFRHALCHSVYLKESEILFFVTKEIFFADNLKQKVYFKPEEVKIFSYLLLENLSKDLFFLEHVSFIQKFIYSPEFTNYTDINDLVDKNRMYKKCHEAQKLRLELISP